MEESGAKENLYHFQFCISDYYAKINVSVQCCMVKGTNVCFLVCLRYEVLTARSTQITGF